MRAGGPSSITDGYGVTDPIAMTSGTRSRNHSTRPNILGQLMIVYEQGCGSGTRRFRQEEAAL